MAKDMGGQRGFVWSSRPTYVRLLCLLFKEETVIWGTHELKLKVRNHHPLGSMGYLFPSYTITYGTFTYLRANHPVKNHINIWQEKVQIVIITTRQSCHRFGGLHAHESPYTENHDTLPWLLQLAYVPFEKQIYFLFLSFPFLFLFFSFLLYNAFQSVGFHLLAHYLLFTCNSNW